MEANRKRAEVHRLPTEDVNPVSVPFLLSPHGNTHKHLAGGEFRRLVKSSYKPQHHYFTTNEEIKEGDCILSKRDNRIEISEISNNTHEILRERWWKIIATTDPKLTIEQSLEGIKGKVPFSLPQPTEEFIKAYCEQGGIDEVDVEYWRSIPDWETDLITPHYDYKLKVDPIHNTITTHRIKNPLLRDCLNAIEYLSDELNTSQYSELIKQIEENL